MFAFWLMPARRDHQIFSALIRELAARFEAPVFEPHLTLRGGVSDREGALRVLREVRTAASYELELEGIFSSATYTKTLFVRFHLSDELRELRNAIARALALESDDEFDPHLSLLYQNLPQGAQAELTSSIAFPTARVRFDGLKLIAHPPKITTRAEVEAWREIGRRRLTNATT